MLPFRFSLHKLKRNGIFLLSENIYIGVFIDLIQS